MYIQIDASAHKTAGEKHNIRGFPTLKLFKSGSVLDYNVRFSFFSRHWPPLSVSC